MACVKRLINLSVFFALALVAQSWFITKAQTPDTKPRATVSVSGRVTIGEKPAPGIIVAATTMNSQTLVAQTVSDGEGKYRINGLIPGQINISAVAPTFVMPISPSSFVQGRVLNLSSDENVEGIDFKLTRGSVITGRVTDADGKPVIEERVTLTPVDEKGQPVRGQTRPANYSGLSTDDRGIYRVFGLPAGRYKVSVGEEAGRTAALRSGYYQRTYHPDTTDASKASIVELGEGGEAKNIDINLAGRSPTYTVSGRIIDADNGQPIAGVTYQFGVVQQSQNQSFMNGMASNSVPTNSKGEFRLEGLTPGRYAITAGSGSFLPQPDQPKVFSDPLPFEITDSDVTDLEIKAQHSLSISGVVVPDGIINKNVLAGFSRLIVISNAGPRPSAIQTFTRSMTSPIAADGTFQLEGVQPGKITLNIGSFSADYGKGYSTSRVVVSDREMPNRQLELAAGQNLSGVRIYVTYGTAVVKGEVKIEGGTVPSDWFLSVVLQRDSQSIRSSGQVDARGRFVISGVSAGTYDAVLQVLALGPSVLPNNMPRAQHQTITVNDDSETQITFTLNLAAKEGP